MRQRIAEEAAERAQDNADRLFIIAWNERMLGGGPAQPSPTIAMAMHHGYRYLRVRCSVCRQTAFLTLADLDWPADTPVWKIEGALACQPCRRDRRRAVILRRALLSTPRASGGAADIQMRQARAS